MKVRSAPTPKPNRGARECASVCYRPRKTPSMTRSRPSFRKRCGASANRTRTSRDSTSRGCLAYARGATVPEGCRLCARVRAASPGAPGPVDGGALDDQTHGAGRQLSCDGSRRGDVNHGFGIAVNRVEVGRIVIGEVHPDHNSLEPAYLRHELRLVDLHLLGSKRRHRPAQPCVAPILQASTRSARRGKRER